MKRGLRLSIELAFPKHWRKRYPAVPFGPGIDMLRICRFLGSLFRALTGLPGLWRYFFPAVSAVTIVDCVILVGNNVAMASHLDLVKRRTGVHWAFC